MFTRGFMLDTSAINRIHDGGECPWSFRGPLYVTDIQLQEIAQTRDRERRASRVAHDRIYESAANRNPAHGSGVRSGVFRVLLLLQQGFCAYDSRKDRADTERCYQRYPLRRGHRSLTPSCLI
jgi:hypothetical protein